MKLTKEAREELMAYQMEWILNTGLPPMGLRVCVIDPNHRHFGLPGEVQGLWGQPKDPLISVVVFRGVSRLSMNFSKQQLKPLEVPKS